MSIAGKNRTDHRGIALAPGAGAQLLDALAPPLDLGRTIAFISERAEDETPDMVGLGLRESRCTDRTGRRAEEMRLGLPGLFYHDRHCGLEILDAARDVGAIARRSGSPVAVVIHRPHVETGAREDVHQGGFAFAGTPEAVEGARGVRHPVHE